MLFVLRSEGIEPPQVAKSAMEGKRCDIVGGTFGESRASPQLQQVISRREITCTILPLGSPKQTYPNYFVTNKVFGFVFYMNSEAENA